MNAGLASDMNLGVSMKSGLEDRNNRERAQRIYGLSAASQ